ncbi:hypothetical protein RHECNPAF_13300165 [Rhizobium etli CNPAF512]|nr:hypothetical protein RHECNPAF_13300165 [Rhizobium etli CNPAF512]
MQHVSAAARRDQSQANPQSRRHARYRATSLVPATRLHRLQLSSTAGPLAALLHFSGFDKSRCSWVNALFNEQGQLSGRRPVSSTPFPP